MSKARARERKKKRLAAAHAAKMAPKVEHDQGTDPIPEEVAEQKVTPPKFDPKSNLQEKGRGKPIPKPAATTRGAARSG